MLHTISHQQIIDRFDTLPQRLKDAILSSGTSDEVWRIGQLSHLNDDKIFRLARIVGRVFLGLLDVDDTTAEIRDYLGIPVELSSSLAWELNRKIFTYYQEDIARAYAPIEGVPPAREKVVQKPEELHPAEVRKEAEAVIRAMPSPATRVPSPMPMPIPMQRPASEPALIPPMKITEHTATTPATPAPQAPQTPSTPPASTPFILHKEEKVKPISELKPIEISFASPESKKPAEKPLVAAELELGKEEEKRREPIIGKTPEQTQRVVHYSDFRTPINPFEKRTTETPKPAPVVPQPSQQIPAPMPKTAIPTPAPTPATPSTTEPAIKPAPVVKMEGNVLDLRQKP